eukprot:1751601-Prymnesium_polylepis.1
MAVCKCSADVSGRLLERGAACTQDEPPRTPGWAGAKPAFLFSPDTHAHTRTDADRPPELDTRAVQ